MVLFVGAFIFKALAFDIHVTNLVFSDLDIRVLASVRRRALTVGVPA